MNVTEVDLRHWEWCFINKCKLPPLNPDELIALWQRHGFSPEVLPVLRKEILKRGYDEMTPEELKNLMEN